MRCLGCGSALDVTTPPDVPCASCGAVRVCPPYEQWPRHLKRWLVDRLVASALAPHGGPCDFAWQHMLAMQLRGTTTALPHGGVASFSRVATPHEVYATALLHATRAEAARQARRTSAPSPTPEDPP